MENAPKITGDSKERVAFDLMNIIESVEDEDQSRNPREYYLKLYKECLHAVNGGDPSPMLA
jgi:hypothetical protein